MRLFCCCGLCLCLLAQGLDALDNEVDSKDDKQNGDDGTDDAPCYVGTGGDQTDLSLDGEYQRGQSYDEHECHREVEHLVVSADLAEPCSDCEQTQSSQQLVCSAEQSPDLCVAGHAEGNAEDDGDSGGNVRIGEDLACAGHILDALAGLHPEFLEHVAGKTGSGVKRGQAECGNCQDQQRVGDLLCAGAEQSAEHGGQAACENCGGDDGGAVGVILPDVRNCAQGDDCQSGLDEHAAVCDGACVAFVVELLCGGAGTNERVEAGDRAAGDGYEQRREQVAQRSTGRGEGILEAGECGHRIDARMAADDADNGEDHHAVEQEGAQVVTGLEQDPNRRYGCDEDVNAADDHPGLVAEVDRMPVQADIHCNGDQNNADDGGNTERSVSSVNEETEEDCQNDEEDGDHRGAGVCGAGCIVDSAVFKVSCLEGVCNDRAECGNDEQEGQVSEDDEQTLCLQTDTVFDNGANGFALVADGCEQCAEVVHTAEEDTADEHPQCNGNPTENGSLNRSVYRACAGDGGEVVSHKDRSLGRNIVHAVFHGVSRSRLAGINSPFLGQPSAVEDITDEQNGNAENK